MFLEEIYNLNQDYTNYIWCDFRETNLLKNRENFGDRVNNNYKVVMLKLKEPTENDILKREDGLYGFMKRRDNFIGGGIICVPETRISEIRKLQMDIFEKLIKSEIFFGCD